MAIIQRDLSGGRQWSTGGNSGRRVAEFNRYGRHGFLRPSHKATFFDDFFGDGLNANITATAKGSDAQTVNFTVSAAVGGMIRATTGDDAAADMATNGVQIDGGSLQWKANAGNLLVGFRAKLSAITDVVFFCGLTDQTGTLEMPFTLSGTTLTSNTSNGVGFLFDTAATTDNFWLVATKADTDTTHQNSTIAPVADTYNDFLIELDSSGNATFWIDDVKRGTQMANAVTATTALTWVVAAFSNAAASRNVDVDYVFVQSDRV